MVKKTFVVSFGLVAALCVGYFLYTWRFNSERTSTHFQESAEISKVTADQESSSDPLTDAITCVSQGIAGKLIVRKIAETGEIRMEPSPENQAFMKALAVIRKHRNPMALTALVKSVNYLDQTATCKETGDWGSSPATAEYYPVPALLVEFGEAAVPHIMDAFASLSDEKLGTDEGRLHDIHLKEALGSILADKANLAFEDAMMRTKDKLAQERLAKAQQRFLAGCYSKLPRNFYALPK